MTNICRPTYNYQRAAYQYYNVSYAENVLLVDPFRPELGWLDAGGLATRLVRNLVRMPMALGEAVSAPTPYWQSALERTKRLFGDHRMPVGVVRVLILGLGALVVAGIVLLVRRRAWLMVFIILGSIGLVCSTPWPVQFPRYLAPLAPFLAIAAVSPLSWIAASLRVRKLRWRITLGRVALASVLVPGFIVQAHTATWLFRGHQSAGCYRACASSEQRGAAAASFSTTVIGRLGRKPWLGSTRTQRRMRSSPRHHRTSAIFSPDAAPFFHRWRSIRYMHGGCWKPFRCPTSLSTSSATLSTLRVAMRFLRWRAIRLPGTSSTKSTRRESTSTRLACSDAISPMVSQSEYIAAL